jgi:thioredoxin 1
MAIAVNELTFNQEVLCASTPVLINFWAPWCGVCRLIDPMLTEVQLEWERQVKVVSINADENLRLANTYRLQTLPTVMLFNGGSLLCRLERFRNRDDLRVAAADIKMMLNSVMAPYSYSASA